MATGNDSIETSVSFGNRMTEIVSNGFAAVGIAVGSATGLFNTMAKFEDPKTSQEIADAARLKERYVREWLGGMVAARIVDIQSDIDAERYILPKHRHKHVCTKDGGGTMAVSLEGVPMICEAYKDVLECFKKDGPKGVPFTKYTLHPPWSDFLATRRLQEKPPNFMTDKEEIRKLLETSSAVCDLGCGSGAALCYLARDFPKSKFYGIDINEKTIMAAKSRAESMQLTNVTFHLGDATNSTQNWTQKFDIVYVMDVIHDVGRPDLLLREIRGLLKDDGIFIMEDIAGHTKHAANRDRPLAGFNYTVSLFRCMPTSLYTEGGFGLGAMWGQERALELLKENGFKCFFVREGSGIFNTAFYCKKSTDLD